MSEKRNEEGLLLSMRNENSIPQAVWRLQTEKNKKNKTTIKYSIKKLNGSTNQKEG